MIFKKIGILDPDGQHLNPLNNKPYSKVYKHIAENGSTDLTKFKEKGGWRHYITYKDRNHIFKLINDNQAVLVVSGTGTGKTVVIPKLLSHYFNYTTPIIVTIPTKKAIDSAAKYAAACLDVQFGVEVALRTGDSDFEYFPERTKLLYSTDGFASSLVEGDEMLYNYGGIIIDEAHTRGVNVDILLSKVVEIAKKRPEFRIIVMSATVDPKEFLNFFKRANITNDLYELEGVKSKHKITDIFNTKPLKVSDLQGEPMLDEIEKIIKNYSTGNILAFVSSESKGETLKRTLQQRLDKNPKAYPNIPWMGVIGGKTRDDLKEIILGNIPITEITPGKYGQFIRKVIFATNAVEFSVTIEDGLDFVIDSGIKFGVYYNYNLNCIVMEPVYVAHSNIKQRCGRTGRIGPGTCIRMYTQKTYNELDEFESPNILMEEISDQVLKFLNMDITNTFKKCNRFLDNMISPIPHINKQVIFKTLLEHNLLGIDGRITNLGVMINNMKIEYANYEIKKMVIASYYFDCMNEVIKIACILAVINRYDLLISPDKSQFVERDDQNPIIAKIIEKFADESGDFMTLLNIYDATLYYINKPAERLQFCKDNYLDIKIIEKIDLIYYEIINTNNGTIQDYKPLIILLNLFDVKNNPKFAKELEYFRLEFQKKPMDFKQIQGGAGLNTQRKAIRNTQEVKETFYPKHQPVNYKNIPIYGGSKLKKSPNKENKKQINKKINKKTPKKNKKKWQPKKTKSFVKKAVENIKSYKKPSIKMPDFAKEFKKNKDTKKISKKSSKLSKKKKFTEPINKKPKPPKRKQNIDYAKKINSALSKLTFQNLKPKHPITISKSKKENILSCIYYGFNTKIAAMVEKDIYQVKNTPLIEIKLSQQENCSLIYNKKHNFDDSDLLCFSSLTNNKAMNTFNLGFTNKIPKKILNNFGLNYEKPNLN